jgi:hypothetical protein
VLIGLLSLFSCEFFLPLFHRGGELLQINQSTN